MDQLLKEILSYRRNYETASEKEFLRNYIATIPNINCDEELNFWIRIGESQTMFSCHTDTVHWSDGRQKYLYFEDLQLAAKTTLKEDPDYDGECLGADDGAGIWIMMNMIEAEVPGLYVFHRGEECGGIGSMHIVENMPEMVTGIQRCIAFDRRGNHDIITHQAGGRCCSEEFAWALATELATIDKEIDMYPCPNGIFTDSANYTHLIPECTNLSVGYQYEHKVAEELDVEFLGNLCRACIMLDWESLPTVREPKAEDWSWLDYALDGNSKKSSGSNVHHGSRTYPTRTKPLSTPWNSQYEMSYQDILEICRSNPELVAEYMYEQQVTYDEIQAIHDDMYGTDGDGFRYRGV